MPEATRAALGAELEAKFTYLFDQRKVGGSKAAIDKHANLVQVQPDLAKEIASA